VHKPKSPDRTKFNPGVRGRYFVAVMPEQAGRFIAEELVAELRRTRPNATLTAIADEYGESERNLRRYLRGNPMPLGKGRRLAKRLADLHQASVELLERISLTHPKVAEAAEPLQNAKRAFQQGYAGLNAALVEHEEIIQADRFAAIRKLKRGTPEPLDQKYERTRLRYEQLRSSLALHEDVIRGGVAAVV
jgi:predicted transcriptional regulator